MDAEGCEGAGIADVHEGTRDGRLTDASPLQPATRHDALRRGIVVSFDLLQAGHDREVWAEAGEGLDESAHAPRGA